MSKKGIGYTVVWQHLEGHRFSTVLVDGFFSTNIHKHPVLLVSIRGIFLFPTSFHSIGERGFGLEMFRQKKNRERERDSSVGRHILELV